MLIPNLRDKSRKINVSLKQDLKLKLKNNLQLADDAFLLTFKFLLYGSTMENFHEAFQYLVN